MSSASNKTTYVVTQHYVNLAKKKRYEVVKVGQLFICLCTSSKSDPTDSSVQKDPVLRKGVTWILFSNTNSHTKPAYPTPSHRANAQKTYQNSSQNLSNASLLTVWFRIHKTFPRVVEADRPPSFACNKWGGGSLGPISPSKIKILKPDQYVSISSLCVESS